MARTSKASKISCVPLRDELTIKGTLTGMMPKPYEPGRDKRFVSNGDSGEVGHAPDQTMPTQRAAEGGPKGADWVGDSPPRHLTVKQLALVSGVKIGAIYDFINTEPDFPVVNKGVRKKYMIDPVQFEIWLAGRTSKQRHRRFAVPSCLDLNKLFSGKATGGVR